MARVIVICITLGLLLAGRFYFHFSSPEKVVNSQIVKFKTTLREEPVVKDGRQRFRIELPTGQRVAVVTGVSPLLQYGDTVFIEGRFTERINGKHTVSLINFPKIQITNNEQNFFTKSSIYLHNKAKKVFEGTLPPDSASLLLGMIFGGREGISEAYLKKLQDVGVVHVIAASGMNVSFVAGVLLAFFGAVFKRQFALVISSLGVVWYAFLAGFEPSITRASVMAILAFAAGLIGRQNFPIFSLGLTGYAMLFYDPSLITDVGFQLSFLSTLGIIILNPMAFQSKNVFMDDIKTTVSAQVATLPLLLGTFGRYSLISIPVNALVLWTVPFLMVFGSLAVLSDIVVEPVSRVFLLLCLPFLLYFQFMVYLFAGLGFTFAVTSFPIWMSLSYYFLLASFLLFVAKLRKKDEGKGVES